MKNIYITLIAISLLTVSCRSDFFNKEIDLDIDERISKLAGTALIGIDDSGRVMVSNTSSPLKVNTESQIVENAVVTLSNSSAVFSLQYDFYLPNIPLDLVPNTAYTLHIEAPDFPTLKATQVYPEAVEILEASITNNNFKIKINDDPNKKNYYLLKVEKSSNGSAFYIHYLDPYSSFSNASSTCDSCVIFTDETFNGEQGFEINTSNFSFQENLTYKAVLYNITEDYYRYDRTLLFNDPEGNPFTQPVILHRNFENGYGIFALANKTELIFNP